MIHLWRHLDSLCQKVLLPERILRHEAYLVANDVTQSFLGQDPWVVWTGVTEAVNRVYDPVPKSLEDCPI